MGYSKVWSHITTSSINDQAIHVRWMWIVLLSQANRHGQVHGTVEALARVANLPLKLAREALDTLAAPDPHSTSSEHEGRRIEHLGGNLWQIINYIKYREMRDTDAAREATRQRVSRFRSRRHVTPGNARVTGGNAHVTPVTRCNSTAEAEAYADAEADTKTTTLSARRSVRTYTEEFLQFWSAYPRKENKGGAFDAWKAKDKTRPPIDKVLAAVAAYCRSSNVARGYVKMPTTWINQDCWDDEPLPAPGLEPLEAVNVCPHCSAEKRPDAEACDACLGYLAEAKEMAR